MEHTRCRDVIQTSMDFLTQIGEIRNIQMIACISSLIMALLLALINIPQTEYTKRLKNAKSAIAISFMMCCLMMGYSIYKYPVITDYELFSSLTMLVVTSFSSIAVSYALINVLDESSINANLIIGITFVQVALSFLLIETATGENHTFAAFCLILNLLLFVGLCIFFIIKFDKVYRKSKKELSAYYDEDEEHKLKWIRFCYIIAMLTDMFLLVYMLLPRGFMRVYVAWYVLFMVYFSANFISFLGSHKIILDAFAHKTLSGDFIPKSTKPVKKEEPVVDMKQRDKEFRTIATNLGKWVEEKKYREYDKSREQIALELECSKEMLQLYFATFMKQDFRNWRTELRINDAKKMLLEDRQASTQLIGEMCGFSDRSNFHTSFVKLVGCSPKEWRERNGKVGNV